MRLPVIYIAVYISLVSVGSGTRSTTSLPSKQVQGEAREAEEIHSRIARSVPAPDSVINFLPIKSVDYESIDSRVKSDRYSESQPGPLLGPWPQPQLPARLSQSQTNPWSLQPQVGKRGKRYRAGGQSSSHYRPDSPQLNMLSDSLTAVEEGAATTMLARQQRNGRRYDVPQIGRNQIKQSQAMS